VACQRWSRRLRPEFTPEKYRDTPREQLGFAQFTLKLAISLVDKASPRAAGHRPDPLTQIAETIRSAGHPTFAVFFGAAQEVVASLPGSRRRHGLPLMVQGF
jgi:hypothetical protein